MRMYGAGPALAPRLMAELGDVRRFHSITALAAFSGIDAPPYQSGIRIEKFHIFLYSKLIPTKKKGHEP